MHQIIEHAPPNFVSEPEPRAVSLREGIAFVTGFLRRRCLIILSCLLVSLVIAGIYLRTASPAYTASAVMMIDTRKGQSLPFGAADGPADAAWVESQIGVLKSHNVAAQVVKQLRLADDPEFTKTERSLFRSEEHTSE